MKKQYFKKGSHIIVEGTLSDCAYIIETGSVKVSKTIGNGEEQLVGILQENDIFGEMGLIDSLPRSANVIALEDCTVTVMTPDIFNSLSKHNPTALMPILKVLARRLRKALEIIEGFEDKKPNRAEG
jgi:CRP/FNR family transcriptional regulator, cyclic AMP receptor protein